MVEPLLTAIQNHPIVSPALSVRKTKKSRAKLPEASKKLIYLSQKVLEMIKVSNVTTGNQIAKAIIAEMIGKSSWYYEIDFKNVQRRVYDALNVLSAMGYIAKERNEIRYLRQAHTIHPINYTDLIAHRKRQIVAKRRLLSEHLLHFASIHKLMSRNRQIPSEDRVPLPCLILAAPKEADFQVTLNTNSVGISFDKPFQLMNDTQMLARLQLHELKPQEIAEDFPEDVFRLVLSEVEEVTEEETEPSEPVDYMKLYKENSEM